MIPDPHPLARLNAGLGDPGSSPGQALPFFKGRLECAARQNVTTDDCGACRGKRCRIGAAVLLLSS
jgi:hypothetical protein